MMMIFLASTDCAYLLIGINCMIAQKTFDFQLRAIYKNYTNASANVWYA